MSTHTTPTADTGGARDVELQHLVDLLTDQSARRLDVIAGPGAIRSDGARLVLEGTEPQISPDGVTMTAGTYQPNSLATGGLADKLGIPAAYLRRLAAEHPDLYDANVNGWLARTDRRFLVRCLRTTDGGGIARAVLSDRYSRIDNLDVLYSVLEGIHNAGVQIRIDGADLTDRRMYLRVYSPQVQAAAPALLAGYRSPFDGRPGSELPTVWGGFVITNSETGCGAFSITPRLLVQVCRNGLVLPRQALRRTHLGSQLAGDDGVVAWSRASTDKTLELITARTTDAVTAYLDTEFLARALREIQTAAGTPVADPDTTLKVVAQRLRFTDEQQKTILAHFIAGADLTAGGVLHAVTSTARTLTDADAAHEMETTAVQAMHLAATG